jgi:hypothetical protein
MRGVGKEVEEVREGVLAAEGAVERVVGRDEQRRGGVGTSGGPDGPGSPVEVVRCGVGSGGAGGEAEDARPRPEEQIERGMPSGEADAELAGVLDDPVRQADQVEAEGLHAAMDPGVSEHQPPHHLVEIKHDLG